MEVDYSGVNSNYTHQAKSFVPVIEEILAGVFYPKVAIFSVRNFEVAPAPFPTDDDNLYIRIWGSSLELQDPERFYQFCGDKFLPSNEQAWGYYIGSRKVWKSGGMGIPITDDQGYVIAELVDSKRLYIHVHILSHQNGLDIFRLIMLRVKDLVFDPRVVDWSNILNKIGPVSKVDYQTEQRELIGFVLAPFDRAITSINKQLNGLRQELSKKETEVQLLSSQVAAGYAHAENDGHEHDLTEQAEELLQQLEQLPLVKGVVVSEDLKLQIFTDTIMALDDRSNKWHRIGNFRITIPSDLRMDRMYFHNLTWRYQDHHAPHVSGDGPCYGNTKVAFHQLSKEGDWLSIVILAIQFLGEANTIDSWGSKVKEWPIIASA